MKTTSPDHAARLIILSSLMYYSLDISMFKDEEFDHLAKLCVDRWDELSEDRKFQLGSRDQLKASGYHVKVSTAAESAAVHWLEIMGYLEGRSVRSAVPYKTKTFKDGSKFRWRPCTAYLFADEE